MNAPQRRRIGGMERMDRAFPVVMKYGGLTGAIVATITAISGHEFGVPLLGLFGSMMGIGQVADAFSKRERP